MGGDRNYRRQLVSFCQDQLAQMNTGAALLLDLKDPLAFRLAVNAAGQTEVRALLHEAHRHRKPAVLCLGIPRAMARAMTCRQPEALAYFENLGRGVLPVIIISTGGCSVAGVPRDRMTPGLN